MRKVKVGKYFVPLWLVIALLVAGVGTSLYHVWKTLTIPLEVKEPLELISCPERLSLYPGQTIEFNVIIRNHAPVNYTVFLDFSLDNITYQTQYVTFSQEVYTIVAGDNTIRAWLKVEPNAPSANVTLTVSFHRGIRTTFTYILSGGTDPSTLFDADDDLVIELNGQPIFVDNDNVITTIVPIQFNASPGDKLRIIGINKFLPTYGIKSHTREGIYLHCEGKSQKLFNEIRVEYGDIIGVFFNETFTIQIP